MRPDGSKILPVVVDTAVFVAFSPVETRFRLAGFWLFAVPPALRFGFRAFDLAAVFGMLFFSDEVFSSVAIFSLILLPSAAVDEETVGEYGMSADVISDVCDSWGV